MWLRIDRLTPKKDTTSLMSQTVLVVEWSEVVVGNRHATKPIQVFMPTLKYNRLSSVRILNMGVLKQSLTMCLGRGWTKERMVNLGWIMRMVVELLLLFDEFTTPSHHIIINIRGTWQEITIGM